MSITGSSRLIDCMNFLIIQFCMTQAIPDLSSFIVVKHIILVHCHFMYVILTLELSEGGREKEPAHEKKLKPNIWAYCTLRNETKRNRCETKPDFKRSSTLMIVTNFC